MPKYEPLAAVARSKSAPSVEGWRAAGRFGIDFGTMHRVPLSTSGTRGVVIFGFSDVCVCRSDRVRKDTKCVIVFSDTPHACWGCVRDVLLPHPLTVPARNGVTCVCARVYVHVCDLLFPHACG